MPTSGQIGLSFPHSFLIKLRFSLIKGAIYKIMLLVHIYINVLFLKPNKLNFAPLTSAMMIQK